MAAAKTESDHVEQLENPEHEALLTGAIALASLFSTCVEAFGLIHPSQKWDKQEQRLLTRLGLQQARLLIWGSVVGITSPPASVTNRAVPKRPSMAYPDLTEPTFFDTRDARLDEPELRTVIEHTLSAIVDRSAGSTREEMMLKFGLKPPKRFGPTLEQAMDTTRLEGFREKYELLREVAEDIAQINTRRNNSLVFTPWMIADISKFGSFIELTQEKVDNLINLLDVKEKVDRAMRMDIRIFGWHIIPDRMRTAQDISKLRLLQEICKDDYPEYLVATQQALDNISREARESAMSSYTLSKEQAKFLQPEDGTNGPADKHKKRPGIFKLFKSFNKKENHLAKGHSHSVSGPSVTAEDLDPPRSMSDLGPDVYRTRSKSIGAEIEPPIMEEEVRNRLAHMETHTSEGASDTTPVFVETFGNKAVDSPFASPTTVLRPAKEPGTIDRHDMYRGIARTETRDLHQADY
ncbi:putative prion-inhibition and propagation, HeLo domain, HeLo domain superfamily [Septoria linicola]|nr:putative prion-inhibition and propagation, HeLo domain, HeLo domain superfamily [Septoria linicola]